MEKQPPPFHHTQPGLFGGVGEIAHPAATSCPTCPSRAQPAALSGPADSRPSGHPRQTAQPPRTYGFSVLADSVAPFIGLPAPAGHSILPLPRAEERARHEGSA